MQNNRLYIGYFVFIYKKSAVRIKIIDKIIRLRLYIAGQRKKGVQNGSEI